MEQDDDWYNVPKTGSKTANDNQSRKEHNESIIANIIGEVNSNGVVVSGSPVRKRTKRNGL